MDDTILCKKCKSVLPKSFDYCPKCGKKTLPPPKPRRRKKGTGSIYMISGNRTKPWIAKLNGIVLDFFTTETEATKYLDQHIKSNIATIGITVEQIYKRYKNTQTYNDFATPTKKNIEINWKKMDTIKNRKIESMKTSDWQQVIYDAVDHGCGYDGCSKIKSLASSLCKNAMLDDIIPRDYSVGVELPKKEDTVNRRNFTEEEILKLFYNDKDRNARIILCMIYTGFRIGELLDIEKAKVNLDEAYIIGGGKTEAGTDRIIPIKEEIYPYITMFMGEDGKYLISNSVGTHMQENNFRNRHFYPLLDRLDFDYKDEQGRNTLTPHRTRHTYITESIASGVKPEILKLLAGHAQYSTSVNKYAKTAQLKLLKSESEKIF